MSWGIGVGCLDAGLGEGSGEGVAAKGVCVCETLDIGYLSFGLGFRIMVLESVSEEAKKGRREDI